MNENIDLTKILKDCPKGTKLYSTIFGEVEFDHIHNGSCTVGYKTNTGRNFDVSYEGKFFFFFYGECTLFPSKEQRDWSKFTAPWYKKERFDPKTLQPFDKVLVRDAGYKTWKSDLFSHIVEEEPDFPYVTISKDFRYCIPYNDDTKHLVGTKDEPSKFYRYWED